MERLSVVWSGSMLHTVSDWGQSKGELLSPRLQRRRSWWQSDPLDPDDDIRCAPMTKPVPVSSLTCAPAFAAR